MCLCKSLWYWALHDLKNRRSSAKPELGRNSRTIAMMTLKEIQNLGKQLTSYLVKFGDVSRFSRNWT
ncbi:MAG: hypothetical protein KatS3mg110_1921 [Pirellulaceae bacterium]|nr:MAG: hypothetical protein KatS3mg110_1921 [Pirellulaceae bacterium]